MTPNEHVYAICCPPEVDCDVISGRKAKNDLGYIVVNVELALNLLALVVSEIFPPKIIS